MGDIVPGVLVRVNDLISRITAPNPGMMTGPGTNTYIVGTRELAVIDPGPESAPHLSATIAAVGDRLKWILCTHTHLDHSPGAKRLKDATGAQLMGFAPAQDDGRQDQTFAPDRVLRDGEIVDCGEFQLRAVHTPGHASNHLCYLIENKGILFTGDHVMQGSTVVISPPDGNMAAYLSSLKKLLALELMAMAPGHGRLIETPHEEARRLIAHRLKREEKVVAAFGKKNPATLDELVPLVYDDVSPRLHTAARRSLHAHLIKLAGEETVNETEGRWKLNN